MTEPDTASAGPVEAASGRPSALRGIAVGFRVVAARSRLLIVFALVFAVVGGWETIRTHWARLTAAKASESVISSDTEYFCPMDPGVLSDWPSKCPVCNMTLVRRKRGESAPLPEGVMARMQVTPYRLWLGGIKTEAVDYAPLAKTFDVPGLVADAGPGSARVEAEVYARELTWIEAGQAVEVVADDEDGRPPVPGKVVDLSGSVEAGSTGRLVVAVRGPADALRPGLRVRVRVRGAVDRLEPFRGQPTTPPPLVPGEPRRLYACMEHPDVVHDAAGRCPRDGVELTARATRADQRVRWWCPMHPGVTADRPGAACDACGGMALAPRLVSYRPPGSVLALPGSAAIDDGSRVLVYVDQGSGVFDAKVVTLGPRCGAMFPVVSGLEPGDRVATRGAFLLDAETRLNPSLAAGYFGAGGRATPGKPDGPAPAPGPREERWLNGLAESDRPGALRQKVCPVTGKPLGSMGVPPKLAVRGRAVFLCCDGCAAAVEADPEAYLAKLPRDVPGGSP